MSKIIPFPLQRRQNRSDLEAVIERALAGIPTKDREKLRFQLIKTIDGYDEYFTEWSVNLPREGGETLQKQLYDLAHQEHRRKMQMLADIIKLKLQVLVDDYRRR